MSFCVDLHVFADSCWKPYVLLRRAAILPGEPFMLRKKARRRPVSIAMLVGGGIMVWAVTPSLIGYVLLGLGVLLEVAGVLLEHGAER